MPYPPTTASTGASAARRKPSGSRRRGRERVPGQVAAAVDQGAGLDGGGHGQGSSVWASGAGRSNRQRCVAFRPIQARPCPTVNERASQNGRQPEKICLRQPEIGEGSSSSGASHRAGRNTRPHRSVAADAAARPRVPRRARSFFPMQAPIRFDPSLESVQPDEGEVQAEMIRVFERIQETTLKDYGHAVRGSTPRATPAHRPPDGAAGPARAAGAGTVRDARHLRGGGAALDQSGRHPGRQRLDAPAASP